MINLRRKTRIIFVYVLASWRNYEFLRIYEIIVKSWLVLLHEVTLCPRSTFKKAKGGKRRPSRKTHANHVVPSGVH